MTRGSRPSSGSAHRLLDVSWVPQDAGGGPGRASGSWELVMDIIEVPPSGTRSRKPTRSARTGWWVPALAGAAAFWSANLVISMTPIAAGYRSALSIPYVPMLVEAAVGGLVVAGALACVLVRLPGAGPGRRAGAQGPAPRRGCSHPAHRARRGALKAAFGPSRPRSLVARGHGVQRGAHPRTQLHHRAGQPPAKDPGGPSFQHRSDVGLWTLVGGHATTRLKV